MLHLQPDLQRRADFSAMLRVEMDRGRLRGGPQLRQATWPCFFLFSQLL